MIIDKIEFVNSISYAMDFVELGLHKSVTNHNRRVAIVALNIGKKLGLTDDELVDLYSYAMFHDNGITYKIYSKMKENGATLENISTHCEAGEENLRLFPFINARENIILYHHERYDGSGFFGIKGEDIPLFSQVIYLADMTEVTFRSTDSRADTISYVAQNSGSAFSDKLCDIFAKLSRSTAFWLSLDDMFVKEEVVSLVPPHSYNIDIDSLFKVSKMLGNIIDAKSPFTQRHSKGLAEKAAIMANFYGYDPLKTKKYTIAAYLHDIGKLVVPNDILDKQGKLDPAEFEIIKCHTFYTRKILGGIKGIEDICEWASNHHEKLNGKGYPYGMSKEDLSEECQLMSCLDIYQALTEERPYRSTASDDEIEAIFAGMILKGELNPDITKDVLRTLPQHFAIAESI